MKFRKALSKGRLIVILMLAAAGMSLASPTVVAPLRRLARMAIAPGGDAGMYVTTAAARRFETAGRDPISQSRARELATENEILRRRLGQLARRLSDADRHLADIQSIHKRLYGVRPEMPSELIPARVVGLDSVPYTASRLIKPSRRVAEKGMLVTTRLLWTDRRGALPDKLMVMTPTALVGRLTETDAFSARLQLVTDLNFRAAVVVRRVVQPDKPRRIFVDGPGGPGEVLLTAANADIYPRSAARGNGAGDMEIPNVKALHAIEPGDEVFTTDSDPAVGAEIPIGTVSEVLGDSEKPGLFVTLLVRPHANMATLRQVYIILPPHSGFVSGQAEGN